MEMKERIAYMLGRWFGFSITWSVVIIVCLLFVGWFNNINYVIDSNFNNISEREIFAVAGIPLIPLGAVNGTIYIFENEK